MPLIRFLLALCLSFTLTVTDFALKGQAAAQDGNSKSQQTRKSELRQPAQSKLDPDLQGLVDTAASVPSEFAADALLRLAESGRIADRATKLELITNAFYLAESAQRPVKMRVGMPLPSDSREAFLASAYRLNLDKLSLQARAVKEMLPLDQAKARSLFAKIEYHLLPVACDESLSYDMSPYYGALGYVLTDGFTEKEKSQGRQAQLLQGYLTGLQSHSQLGPLSLLLSTLDLPDEGKEELTYLVNSLFTIPVADKRSFATAAKFGDFDSVSKLLIALDRKGVPIIAALPAFRNYVLVNFQAAPCAEILSEPAQANSLSEAATYFVHRFNELLPADTQNYPAGSIRSDEIDTGPERPPRAIHDYWQSAKSKELLEGIRKLKFGNGETLLSEDQRKTSAWSAQLDDFLKQFESWEQGQQPADDFFFEKAVIYRDLLETIPSGSRRSMILSSYTTFLSNNEFKLQDPVEWLWQVHLVIAEVRIRGLDVQEELLQSFQNSRDSSLSLYARLERVAPGSKKRLN